MYRAHRIRRLLFLGIVTTTVFNLILMFNKPLENAHEFSEKVSWDKERMEMRRNIWVSMGLCFSKNTQLFGKSSYPYKKVLLMTVKLWELLPSS